jgi:hypothetical protein
MIFRVSARRTRMAEGRKSTAEIGAREGNAAFCLVYRLLIYLPSHANCRWSLGNCRIAILRDPDNSPPYRQAPHSPRFHDVTTTPSEWDFILDAPAYARARLSLSQTLRRILGSLNPIFAARFKYTRYGKFVNNPAPMQNLIVS